MVNGEVEERERLLLRITYDMTMKMIVPERTKLHRSFVSKGILPKLRKIELGEKRFAE